VVEVRRDSRVVRRVVAVFDDPYSFEFFGEHVIGRGAEFVIGDGEGRVLLDDSGDLLFRVAPECIQRIPFRHFHLETEEEVHDIVVHTRRHLTRMI